LLWLTWLDVLEGNASLFGPVLYDAFFISFTIAFGGLDFFGVRGIQLK